MDVHQIQHLRTGTTASRGKGDKHADALAENTDIHTDRQTDRRTDGRTDGRMDVEKHHMVNQSHRRNGNFGKNISIFS